MFQQYCKVCVATCSLAPFTAKHKHSHPVKSSESRCAQLCRTLRDSPDFHYILNNVIISTPSSTYVITTRTITDSPHMLTPTCSYDSPGSSLMSCRARSWSARFYYRKTSLVSSRTTWLTTMRLTGISSTRSSMASLQAVRQCSFFHHSNFPWNLENRDTFCQGICVSNSKNSRAVNSC